MEPAIFVPFIMLLAPVLVVLIVLRYRHQQTQARYQALLHLADKGVFLERAARAATAKSH